MKTVTNLGDLIYLHINPYIIKAMKLTEDIICNILSEKIDDFYEEEIFEHGKRSELCNVPLMYNRTYQLSADSSLYKETRLSGNYIIGRAGFSDSYLEFRYKTGKHPTGLQVVRMFNNYGHGAEDLHYVDGSHAYWDETLKEICTRYGSVEELFIKNLKEVGLKLS